MPAGRDQRRAARLSEGLRGLLDMGAGALKGGVQALVGLPGDLEEWRRDVGGSESARVLPTSKEVGEYLPGTGRDTKTWESVGEQLNPVESLKPLLAAGKGAAAAKAGLYAGALRKDLLHSHNTNATSLLTQGKFPAELYNLSLGVTKNASTDFNRGNTLLVPRYGAFDPKTSPSALHAFDAYTPRHNQAQGERADSLRAKLLDVKDLKELESKAPPMTEEGRRLFEQMLNAQDDLRPDARKRLVDRFVSQYPKGGMLAEGHGSPPRVDDLPKYGRGGYRGFDVRALKAPGAAQESSYGHRFPSFKDYEASPFGAGRLDAGPAADKLYNDADNFLVQNEGKIKDNLGIKLPQVYSITYTEGMQTLQEIAKKKVFPDSSVGRISLIKQAQELMAQLRRTKSDYGELKVFGPVGLHNDNFAGMIVDSGMTPQMQKFMKEQAKKRGLEFDVEQLTGHNDYGDPVDKLVPFNLAKQMQDYRR